MRFLPGEIRVALPRGKPAAIESRYPTYGACRAFECFHNPTNSGMDYRSFNVRMRLHTQWCTDTARESALNVDSGRKIPYRTRGNRTCLSGVLVQRSTN